jgi:hypothetical protein
MVAIWMVSALAVTLAGCELTVPSNDDECEALEHDCHALQFVCANNACVAGPDVCDGENDCGDNSDEIGCPCAWDEFTCSDGTCVLPADVCDGTDHCPDGGDEVDCGGCISCNDWLNACMTTGCPDAGWVCSGASTDALTALGDCICNPAGAACNDECPYFCGTATDPSDDHTQACVDCQSYALAAACTAEVTTCINN